MTDYPTSHPVWLLVSIFSGNCVIIASEQLKGLKKRRHWNGVNILLKVDRDVVVLFYCNPMHLGVAILYVLFITCTNRFASIYLSLAIDLYLFIWTPNQFVQVCVKKLYPGSIYIYIYIKCRNICIDRRVLIKTILTYKLACMSVLLLIRLWLLIAL